ncbi:hypothetical protein BR93DRAFT_391148 [Coniochaeta sp. PMI_546]|nr:hypothetical protein BR93DRAFT_391148 [Coniochaeta sp. PMI_546]
MSPCSGLKLRLSFSGGQCLPASVMFQPLNHVLGLIALSRRDPPSLKKRSGLAPGTDLDRHLPSPRSKNLPCRADLTCPCAISDRQRRVVLCTLTGSNSRDHSRIFKPQICFCMIHGTAPPDLRRLRAENQLWISSHRDEGEGVSPATKAT